jgi:drug/metabolite transporter (DMT)-like permease
MPANGNALRGIGLVALAVLMFAGSDVLTKHLVLALSIPLIMTMRNLVSLGLLALVLGPSEGAGLWRTARPWLVVLRGACLAAGSLTMGLALRVMPVGETVAIVYLAPILVMLLAVPLLGEKVAVWGWIFAACGFLGVLLIARPGSGLDGMGVVYCLINAVCASAYHLLTRVLARTERTSALMFHTALVSLVVFGALVLLAPWDAMPSLTDWGLMGLLGVLATGGHFLFTAAYREAPASLLAPVNYLHLVWAGVLGWLVFGHMPDALSVAGMALVAAAGAAIALHAGLSRPAAPLVVAPLRDQPEIS